MNSNDTAPPPVALPNGVPIVEPPRRLAYRGTKVLVILYMLPSVGAMVMAASASNPRRVGMGLGMLILLLFVWGLAVFIWRIAGRSNRAYNLTLIIGVTFLFLGRFGSIAANARKARVNQTLNRQVAQLNADADAMQRSAADARARGETVDPAEARNLVGSLDNIASTASGNAKLESAASSAVLKKLIAFSEERNAANSRFDEVGGINAETMLTIALIDERLRLADELIAAQEPIRTFQFDQEIISELRRSGAAPSFIQAIASNLATNPRIALQKEMYQADHDAFVKGRELIVMLRETHGDWSFDASQDAIVFETDEQINRYDRILNEINQISARQTELLRRNSSMGG